MNINRFMIGVGGGITAVFIGTLGYRAGMLYMQKRSVVDLAVFNEGILVGNLMGLISILLAGFFVGRTVRRMNEREDIAVCHLKEAKSLHERFQWVVNAERQRAGFWKRKAQKGKR